MAPRFSTVELDAPENIREDWALLDIELKSYILEFTLDSHQTDDRYTDPLRMLARWFFGRGGDPGAIWKYVEDDPFNFGPTGVDKHGVPNRLFEPLEVNFEYTTEKSTRNLHIHIQAYAKLLCYGRPKWDLTKEGKMLNEMNAAWYQILDHYEIEHKAKLYFHMTRGSDMGFISRRYVRKKLMRERFQWARAQQKESLE